MRDSEFVSTSFVLKQAVFFCIDFEKVLRRVSVDDDAPHPSSDAPSTSTHHRSSDAIVCENRAENTRRLPAIQPLHCGTFASCQQPLWVLPFHLWIFPCLQACCDEDASESRSRSMRGFGDSLRVKVED
jgi:hypothetical protein